MEKCSHKGSRIEEMEFKGRILKLRICDQCANEAALASQKDLDVQNINQSVRSSDIPAYLLDKLPLDLLSNQSKVNDIFNSLDSGGMEHHEEYPYLWGSNGTGKTMLSVDWLNRLILKHKGKITVKYIRISELSRVNRFQIAETIEKLTVGHYAVLIDDLGNHNTYDHTLEALIDMIEVRLATGKRTIITSNYKPTQLAEKLSQNTSGFGGANVNMCNAIVDRILELCNPVELSGSSLRIGSAIERIKGLKNGN